MEVPWKSAKKSRWTLEVSKEVQIVYRLFLACGMGFLVDCYLLHGNILSETEAEDYRLWKYQMWSFQG